MTGRRAIAGLCMLCALLVSAFAAQSASAATNGTTAFTCAKVTPAVGTAGFSEEHCKPASAVTTLAAYEHVALSKSSTAITGSGGTTLLHSVISGINTELKSTELTGSGTMENMLAENGEHTANGTGKIEYKEVTVAKPEGKSCKVKTGEVKTNELKATTAGQGMGLKFEPATGPTGVFAKFEVEGCTGSKALEALNGVYEVTGSVVGTPDGATTVTTAAGTTAQATLKLRGQNAGIDGSLTIKGENGNGLSATTVETP